MGRSPLLYLQSTVIYIIPIHIYINLYVFVESMSMIYDLWSFGTEYY